MIAKFSSPQTRRGVSCRKRLRVRAGFGGCLFGNAGDPRQAPADETRPTVSGVGQGGPRGLAFFRPPPASDAHSRTPRQYSSISSRIDLRSSRRRSNTNPGPLGKRGPGRGRRSIQRGTDGGGASGHADLAEQVRRGRAFGRLRAPPGPATPPGIRWARLRSSPKRGTRRAALRDAVIGGRSHMNFCTPAASAPRSARPDAHPRRDRARAPPICIISHPRAIRAGDGRAWDTRRARLGGPGPRPWRGGPSPRAPRANLTPRSTRASWYSRPRRRTTSSGCPPTWNSHPRRVPPRLALPPQPRERMDRGSPSTPPRGAPTSRASPPR